MDPHSLAAMVQSQSNQIAELQEAAKKRDAAYNALFSKFAETNLGGVEPPPQHKGKSKSKPKGSPKFNPVPVPEPVSSTPKPFKTSQQSISMKTTRKYKMSPKSRGSATKTSTPAAMPSPKWDPNKMLMKDAPAEFEPTKVQ